MTHRSVSENSSQSSKKPVCEVRYGLIKAAVWENNTKTGPRYRVTVCRLFKDGDVWKESTRFGLHDLLTLAKVANDAHTWICTRG